MRWPPSKEAELGNYVAAFSAKLTAAPTTYGLVAADASGFATVVTTFINAHNLASDPATRTAAAVATKDVAKANCLALLRSLAKRIQANPAVTAAQKADLGLPIHDTEPTPRPAPETRPVLTVLERGPLSQTLKIADETTPTRRARPYGTRGAEIYAWLGTEAPPDDLRQWAYLGQATQSIYEISYPAGDANKIATLAARWFNDKGETGPLSLPITARVAA